MADEIDLAAVLERMERIEREHKEICEALGVLDRALAAALGMLKAHHSILERSIKRVSGNTPDDKILN